MHSVMGSNSDNNKRIAKNTLLLYIRMLFIFFISLYTTRVVLDKLGVEDYGLYNVVAGFVTMLGFVSQTMTNSIQRFINYKLGEKDLSGVKKYFESCLTVQLALSALLLLILETLGLWFLNHKMNIADDKLVVANIVYHCSCASLVLNLIKTPFNAIVIAKEKMSFYAYTSIVEAVIKLVIAYSLMVSTNNRLVIYAFLLLLLTVLLFIICAIYSMRLIPVLRVRLNFEKNIFKDVLSFSGWNLFGSLSTVAKSQGINVIINLFFGVTINAARGVAYQVLGAINQFTSNFQVAINPQIVQSYAAKERNRYLQLTYASAKFSLYFMWFISLPVLFCLDSLLGLWLGENVPEYSAIFIRIILITALVDALGSSLTVPIYATGDIKKAQIVVSFIKLSVLPIAYFLYKIGCPPESSMYAALGISVASHWARVRIWSSLVEVSSWTYVKSIVIPALIILFSSCLSMYVWSMLFNPNKRITEILMVSFVSVLVNTPLILFVGLSKSERCLFKSYLIMFKNKIIK